MKMLVSDYDDTFYLNDKDVKININLVNRFMIDNYFVIATGRSYLDYQKKNKLYNIPSNYLIINHGATILKNDNIIFNVCIDNSIRNNILEDLKLEIAVDYFLCFKKESTFSLDANEITKIHVKYSTEEEAKKINDKLLKKYGNKINTFFVCKNKSIEIVSKSANKAEAIKFIAKLENIKEEDIYTIGDSYTDVQMIKEFNGFAMENSIEELKEISNKKYESVSDLIREILKENS